ncbi:MAG: hypothetical protein F6K24_02870 [Okeania sp. SIO2D1]|nr:hypothetical protein [Okeania sp. SIO2D1]
MSTNSSKINLSKLAKKIGSLEALRLEALHGGIGDRYAWVLDALINSGVSNRLSQKLALSLIKMHPDALSEKLIDKLKRFRYLFDCFLSAHKRPQEVREAIASEKFNFLLWVYQQK